MSITAQEIDDAIADRNNSSEVREMLTKFLTLHNWCRRRWMTGDEPQRFPDTILEARREQKELDHGRPWNG